MGLSPRLRGNGLQGAQTKPGGGSIPALAGERLDPSISQPRSRVYPRACGGTDLEGMAKAAAAGLSPRLRGNALRYSSGDIFRRVYPRACGGTAGISGSLVARTGLSPRLRGNGFEGLTSLSTHGSIPALAGERRNPCSDGAILWVYPRACGGTRNGRRVHNVKMGLSPRLRGNVQALARPVRRLGSIPALAGERGAELLR